MMMGVPAGVPTMGSVPPSAPPPSASAPTLSGYVPPAPSAPPPSNRPHVILFINIGSDDVVVNHRRTRTPWPTIGSPTAISTAVS
eukprot:COSAG01_NODE_8361_length_2817_cov_1.478661_3_plen_84_part_01